MNETRLPARYALLVGINAYRHRLPLRGCINDLELTRETLRDRFGFELERIQMLKDDQATLEAIRAAMGALAAEVGPDDLVVFYFSGSGSQIRDPSGVDGWVNSLVLSDSGRGDVPNRDLRVAEIVAWIVELVGRGASRLKVV